MTTGQRLTDLRKQHNYTQEQLGEILDVSRQSISKWESDLAFPETQKIIELSNLYGCTIDYLLGQSKKMPESNTTSASTKLKFEMTPKLFTMLWSLGHLVIVLFLYALPILSIPFQNPISGFPFDTTTIFVNVSTYQLLANGPTEIGNALVFFAGLIILAISVLSVLIYVQSENKYYKIRRILSFVEVGLWVLFALIFIQYLRVGIFLIVITSSINIIGLYKVSNNLVTRDSN